MTTTHDRSQAPSGKPGKGSSRLPALVTGLVLAVSLLTTAGATAIRPAAGADPSAATPATEADPAFPRTLIDDEGTSVVIASRPERVISLSPANTEIVFAIGAGGRQVGGTDFDDFPPEAAALADVATYNGVLLEQVVALEPDLVLAAGNGFTPAADIDRMRELGLAVLVTYAATVDGVLADIGLIGEALGGEAAAAELTAAMRDDIETVTTAAAAIDARPRVYYQIGSQPELYAPAPGSFLADLVALAGGDPITTGDPSAFSIPLERLVASDPQVIVVGDALYGICPADVMARPGWDVMSAVRTGDVRPVDDTVITRPGPRLALGLAALARAIHPEIELPGIPEVAPPCSDPVPTPDPPATVRP